MKHVEDSNDLKSTTIIAVIQSVQYVPLLDLCGYQKQLNSQPIV